MIRSRSLTSRSAHSGFNGPLDQQPPHSVEMEKGVLSSMMVGGRDAIGECVEKITVDYFFVPAHQTIFSVLVEMWNADQKIDLLTFTEELRDRNLLDGVGGAAAVMELQTLTAELQNFVPTAANVDYYIDIVREKYVQREVIRAGKEMIRQASEPQADAEAVVAEAELRIASLKSIRGHNGNLPEAVPLMALAERQPDPSSSLLGNRFLCRGGGMLFVGPSGIGKSSASAQQDIKWALGLEAFGIKPSQALRTLCIQAENDDEDLAEMVNGICDRLNLSAAERAQVAANVLYVSDCVHIGESFLQMAARLLEKHGPFDLLRIDTLLGYLGGDILDVECTSKFLRNRLNAIVRDHGCGVIINHHTPKPTNRDTSNWRVSDWMYSGSGNADVTNWARGALVINPTHVADVYEFHAAKRGKRIGWCDEKGQTIYSRLFCWDKGEAIYWREAAPEDAERVESSKPKGAKRRSPQTKEDVKALVPLERSIAKNILIRHAQERGIGVNRARDFLSELVEEKELFEWRVKRPRTNPEVRISRHEQELI